MANERSSEHVDVEQSFFGNLFREVVEGDIDSLKGYQPKVLRELGRRLDSRYGETFAQLEETASPEQRGLINKLNKLRRASDLVGTFLGGRRSGTALRLDEAPVAPNAPMPSKRNR